MKLSSYIDKSGISQAQFARLIGASPSAITRWIAGSRRPDLEQLQAIRRVTRGAVTHEDFYELSCDPLDWRCRVRAWALENNFELREIASKLDIAKSYFSSLMSGAERPSMRLARRIVAATDQSIRLEAFIEPRSDHNKPVRGTARKTARKVRASRERKNHRVHA